MQSFTTFLREQDQQVPMPGQNQQAPMPGQDQQAPMPGQDQQASQQADQIAAETDRFGLALQKLGVPLDTIRPEMTALIAKIDQAQQPAGRQALAQRWRSQ